MFYTQELLMVLFTIIMIGQQYYATWAYREYAQPHTIQSRWLHIFNWLLVGLFNGFILFLTNSNWLYYIVISFCNLLIYSALFNTGYSLTISKFKHAFYLGDEAKSDEKIKQLLGKNEGRTLFIIQIILLLALNLVYKFLLK